MEAIASQITSLTIVYSIVYSEVDQRKHQSSASLAFVWGIHRGPVNSPHTWPVTRKMFPFDDVIMKILEQPCSQISKTLGSTSIWYRSDTFASDRYLIDVKSILRYLLSGMFWRMWINKSMWIHDELLLWYNKKNENKNFVHILFGYFVYMHGWMGAFHEWSIYLRYIGNISMLCRLHKSPFID